jgi:hypothetical protein
MDSTESARHSTSPDHTSRTARLRGGVAVVTGAGGGGCGRAIALRCAAEGAAVVVCDVNEAGGEETVRLISGQGGRAVPSVLLRPEQIAGAVLHLATDESLVGRVLLWWSEDEPRLIRWGDRGYAGADGISWREPI